MSLSLRRGHAEAGCGTYASGIYFSRNKHDAPHVYNRAWEVMQSMRDPRCAMFEDALSGPRMLAPATEVAVRTWRCRPYLLNGEPVEVETTVNIIFHVGD
jgi:hypothetical protein